MDNMDTTHRPDDIERDVFYPTKHNNIFITY